MTEQKITLQNKDTDDHKNSTNKKIRYFLSNNNEFIQEKDTTNSNINNDKYWHNEKEVTLDKEVNGDTKQEFKNQIKICVSAFVNKGFDNIIVLLGAGASVVNKGTEEEKKKYGKTVKQLKAIINTELKSTNSDLLSIEDLSSEIGFKCESFDSLNFEDFLSHLEGFCLYNVPSDKNSESDHNKLISKINKSKDKIYELIKSNLKYKYSNEVFKHGALINVALNLATKSNKVHFVTTNYDTLIEDAAEKVHVTVFDGFTFSKEPVFDSDMFEWNLVRDVPYVNTSELEYKKKSNKSFETSWLFILGKRRWHCV